MPPARSAVPARSARCCRRRSPRASTACDTGRAPANDTRSRLGSGIAAASEPATSRRSSLGAPPSKVGVHARCTVSPTLTAWQHRRRRGRHRHADVRQDFVGRRAGSAGAERTDAHVERPGRRGDVEIGAARPVGSETIGGRRHPALEHIAGGRRSDGRGVPAERDEVAGHRRDPQPARRLHRGRCGHGDSDGHGVAGPVDGLGAIGELSTPTNPGFGHVGHRAVTAERERAVRRCSR